MTTESPVLVVSGIAVEVVRKPIKHLHLGVYPPHGRVRVAAPLAVNDEAVRLAVVDKLGWIRRQRRGQASVVLRDRGTIELRAGRETTSEDRQRVLHNWYRQQLRALMPALVLKWQSRLKVNPLGWGIKKMKTKWGSCRVETGRIWVNLELAKKPPECLEYIVVHGLVHLLERNHNERFAALMDAALPGWRLLKDELNQEPLAHENWTF